MSLMVSVKTLTVTMYPKLYPSAKLIVSVSKIDDSQCNSNNIMIRMT